jgi:hypothetical protein
VGKAARQRQQQPDALRGMLVQERSVEQVVGVSGQEQKWTVRRRSSQTRQGSIDVPTTRRAAPLGSRGLALASTSSACEMNRGGIDYWQSNYSTCAYESAAFERGAKKSRARGHSRSGNFDYHTSEPKRTSRLLARHDYPRLT